MKILIESLSDGDYDAEVIDLPPMVQKDFPIGGSARHQSIEWRIVEIAEERFPDAEHRFYYDAEGPACEIITRGKLLDKIRIISEA